MVLRGEQLDRDERLGAFVARVPLEDPDLRDFLSTDLDRVAGRREVDVVVDVVQKEAELSKQQEEINKAKEELEGLKEEEENLSDEDFFFDEEVTSPGRYWLMILLTAPTVDRFGRCCDFFATITYRPFGTRSHGSAWPASRDGFQASMQDACQPLRGTVESH